MNLIKATLVLGILASTTCFAGARGGKGGGKTPVNALPAASGEQAQGDGSAQTTSATTLVPTSGTFDSSALPTPLPMSTLGISSDSSSASSSTGDLPSAASTAAGTPVLMHVSGKKETPLDLLNKLAREHKNQETTYSAGVGALSKVFNANEAWQRGYVLNDFTKRLHEILLLVQQHDPNEIIHNPNYISALKWYADRADCANRLMLKASQASPIDYFLINELVKDRPYLLSLTILNHGKILLQKRQELLGIESQQHAAALGKTDR